MSQDWSNHLSKAVIDILVIKLSQVKDSKSATGLNGSGIEKKADPPAEKRKVKSMTKLKDK